MCRACLSPTPLRPQAVLNPDLPDPEEAQTQEQEQIDSAEPLTEEEVKEKEDLLQQVRRHPPSVPPTVDSR